MKRQDFLDYMEEMAPASLAEGWDNVGMLVDCGAGEFHRVLIALEISEPVVEEALEWGADLILTHHPVMLRPIQRLDGGNAESRCLLKMIRHGVSHFAAHTNLDCARRGTNAYLARGLGLLDAVPLEAKEGEAGMGRVGDLPLPCTARELCGRVKELLGIPAMRMAGDGERRITRLAVCSGSGADFAARAAEMGAQALLTGDLKHHAAAEAAGMGMVILDAGHFETERPIVHWLIEGLQEHFDGVQCNTAFRVSSAERPAIVIV